MKKYQLWPFNFGALHQQDFKKAKVVIVPVPYEATVSYKPGTKDGPYAIISNSRYLDEISGNDEPVGFKQTDIFTLDEVELSLNSPKEALLGVEQVIEDEVLSHNKIPLMLGGEHSITFGAISAMVKKYPDLSVLHLDAHTDLMDEHEGTKYNHACVIRRVRELGVKVVSVGIRNINSEIKEYFKGQGMKGIFFAPKIPLITKITQHLTKHVYLTVDLDVLDPGVMPSVGTPEPGGFSWYEVLKTIQGAAKTKKIIGADVVELSPIPGLIAPDFLAAKLTYQIISLMV